MLNGRNTFISGVAALAGILIFGCGAGEDAQPLAGSGDPAAHGPTLFQRELLALKAGQKDPERLEKETWDLVIRHGFPVPKEEAPVTGGPASTQAPLAKTAAASQNLEVKNFLAETVTSSLHSATVASGTRIQVTTVNSTGATDPSLVAYYLVGTGNARTIKVVGFGDDSGSSVEATIDWTNKTGASKTVYYLVFARSSATRGSADMRVKIGTTLSSHSDQSVGGKVYYTNNLTANPSSHCHGPRQSIIYGQVDQADYHTQVLAVSSVTKEGMWLKAYDEGIEQLGTFIPSGSPNFVLGFVDRSAAPVVKGPAKFRVIQKDTYECVF